MPQSLLNRSRPFAGDGVAATQASCESGAPLQPFWEAIGLGTGRSVAKQEGAGYNKAVKQIVRTITPLAERMPSYVHHRNYRPENVLKTMCFAGKIAIWLSERCKVFGSVAMYHQVLQCIKL